MRIIQGTLKSTKDGFHVDTDQESHKLEIFSFGDCTYNDGQKVRAIILDDKCHLCHKFEGFFQNYVFGYLTNWSVGTSDLIIQLVEGYDPTKEVMTAPVLTLGKKVVVKKSNIIDYN